ncbi:signal recognition particle-docking protein FtsY [Desulforhopalus sp. 52FAK]
MLGWFKKKFGKKEEAPTPEVVVENSQEEELQVHDEATAEPPIPAQAVPTPAPAPETPATEAAVEPTSPTSEEIPTKPETIAEKDNQQKPPEVNTKESIAEPITEPTPIQKPEIVAGATPTKSPKKPVAEISSDNTSTSKIETKKDSLFSRLSNRLGKTKESFTYQLDALFLGKKEIDTDLLDSLEEILITADLGVETAEELVSYARKKVKRKELSDPNALKDIIKEQIRKYIVASETDATLVMPDSGPFVIMVIGVNGVGKTTTIGKVANKFKQSGNSVMLIAADTFRAAAVSQLKIWGERNDVPVISQHEGADPSSVVFDGLTAALASDVDVVLVDTAGRMHTKDNLMEELKKIKRVMAKKLKGAPHEVMLVIDATTGQNGISQARLFDAAVDVTGLALTKLDGTSKGGIVVNICHDMKIPIRFIGIGEQMDDLRDFDASEFVDALFQSE